MSFECNTCPVSTSDRCSAWLCSVDEPNATHTRKSTGRPSFRSTLTICTTNQSHLQCWPSKKWPIIKNSSFSCSVADDSDQRDLIVFNLPVCGRKHSWSVHSRSLLAIDRMRSIGLFRETFWKRIRSHCRYRIQRPTRSWVLKHC